MQVAGKHDVDTTPCGLHRVALDEDVAQFIAPGQGSRHEIPAAQACQIPQAYPFLPSTCPLSLPGQKLLLPCGQEAWTSTLLAFFHSLDHTGLVLRTSQHFKASKPQSPQPPSCPPASRSFAVLEAQKTGNHDLKIQFCSAQTVLILFKACSTSYVFTTF